MYCCTYIHQLDGIDPPHFLVESFKWTSCFRGIHLTSCLFGWIMVFHESHHRYQCVWIQLIIYNRGRVVKGVGHLDHVWSYGVREVVSSIPDRGNIVGWVFHPTQVTGTVSSSEHAFPSKFWIYLEHCPRGEAVIYRPSAPLLYEVASHVKNCHSGHYSGHSGHWLQPGKAVTDPMLACFIWLKTLKIYGRNCFWSILVLDRPTSNMTACDNEVFSVCITNNYHCLISLLQVITKIADAVPYTTSIVDAFFHTSGT